MAVIDWLIPEHKAERAHTRNTAWSRKLAAVYSRFTLLSHSCSCFFFLPPDWQPTLLCRSLTFPTSSPSCSLFTDLPNYHSPLPLSLCWVIVSGIAKQGRSRPEVTIPLWLTSWSFISMVTVIPPIVTIFSFFFFLLLAQKYQGELKLSQQRSIVTI